MERSLCSVKLCGWVDRRRMLGPTIIYVSNRVAQFVICSGYRIFICISLFEN